MLCYKYVDCGEICTNQCPDFLMCDALKIPLLVHVTNVCCSIGENGLKVHELYPESSVNGVVG